MTQKTILIIRNAAPKDFGGAETYPVSLAEIIKTKEYIPIIISASEKLLSYASNQGISTIRGKWLNKQNWTSVRILLTPLYLMWQVYLTCWYISIIKKTNAQTLHIQSRDDFIAASVAGKIMHRKVIWTDHMDLRYVFENITKPLRNIVGKMVFWVSRFADHIILISDNEYRLVTSHFKNPNTLSDKIVIIKNGVIDKKNNYPNTSSSDTPFIFCLVSRIVKNKGIGEAIEAFKKLPIETNRPAELHIYGDGEDIDYFKETAKDIPTITLFGHTSDPLAAMNSADVYILPSYQEGFSIALLEATMLGKAIIASDVDSNSEIIIDRKTGLLVPAKDSGALSKAMYELYSNSSLIEKYGAAARARYEANFNLTEKVEKEILPLY